MKTDQYRSGLDELANDAMPERFMIHGLVPQGMGGG